MIYTARQLEDLWKANGSNGQVVLPYRARLSPMASDWIKSKRLTIGYSDDGGAKIETPSKEKPSPAPAPPGSFLWWCDGPCGTAKAALSAQARESSLAPIDILSEPSRLVSVIRKIAAEIKSERAPGALLMTQSAADECFVNGLQTDSADDQSYPHVVSSWRDRLVSSESSRLALTKREMRLRICWRVLWGYSMIRTLAAT